MTSEIIIWYFTGTGQCGILSEYIAADLEKNGWQAKTTDITPFNIRNYMKWPIDRAQLILVFPVYGGDMPQPLIEFIKDLKADRLPIILVALWGNAHKGKAIYNAWKTLCGNGFIVNGAAEIVAEHSYLKQKFPIIGEKPTEFEKHELVEYVKKQFLINESIKPEFNNDNLLIKMLCSLPAGSVPRLVAKLNYQQDKCNSCDICRKKCPTRAISADFKVDKKRCIMCLSCVTNCKREARKFEINELGKKALGHHQKHQYKNVFY
jgi:ferredoxin